MARDILGLASVMAVMFWILAGMLQLKSPVLLGYCRHSSIKPRRPLCDDHVWKQGSWPKIGRALRLKNR